MNERTNQSSVHTHQPTDSPKQLTTVHHHVFFLFHYTASHPMASSFLWFGRCFVWITCHPVTFVDLSFTTTTTTTTTTINASLSVPFEIDHRLNWQNCDDLSNSTIRRHRINPASKRQDRHISADLMTPPSRHAGLRRSHVRCVPVCVCVSLACCCVSVWHTLWNDPSWGRRKKNFRERKSGRGLSREATTIVRDGRVRYRYVLS